MPNLSAPRLALPGPPGPSGPPTVTPGALTSDYDQTIRQTGPTGGPFQLLFRRNKEAYLNDRNDIDATGASDMGPTINTYLSEYAAAKIYHVYCDSGSAYKVASTITMPRALMLEGPLRKGQTTYPNTTDSPARFIAAGSNFRMFTLTTGTGGTNGVTLRGLAIDLGKSLTYTGVVGAWAQYGTEQVIEHCQFSNGAADSTAIQFLDCLYVTIQDNTMTGLDGYGITANASGSYYGINVGTISRNIFSGQQGAFQASGIFALRDNDFESGSGVIGAAVTLGQAGQNTSAEVTGNYFEGGKYHIHLLGGGLNADIRRNDIYGLTKASVGSYGVKVDNPISLLMLEGNTFTSVETAIALAAQVANNAGQLMFANFFNDVTNKVTGGQTGWKGYGNTIPVLLNRGDGRVTYEGALTGGAILYDISADTAIDLAQGNFFHIRANANLTLTFTNRVDAGQTITLVNTGTGTITLPFTTWLTQEGVDAYLVPGTMRVFVTSNSGYSFGARAREVAPKSKPPSVQTAAFTVTAAADVYLCDATTAAFTATLPSAAPWTSGPLTVKKTDSSANAVTVGTTSSQTIDGATTYALSTQYAAITVRPSGGNWFIVNKV